ncbi:hypothetical protein PYW07_015175 [Mythimna separata]|uniref:Uncharacterized protein n=1 Tax=Mythimna separata TaxID=271217 RepID=A0AAD7YZ02_MYTSE|nr:hypothetical protein PYW07_015175 [Mythimna separata]
MDDTEAVQGSATEASIKSSPARVSPRRSNSSATPIPSPTDQLPKYAVASPPRLSDKVYKSPESPKHADSSTNGMPNGQARSPKSQSPKNAVSSPAGILDKVTKAMRTASGLTEVDDDFLDRTNANDEDFPQIDIRHFSPKGDTGCTKKAPDCERNTSKTKNLTTNIDKISCMSKALTCEANALRESIKCLTADIARTKMELCSCQEDVNFPYHLFLIEMIINKIHMKCECFDIDYNNLVISAVFLGKPPIVLYDSSYGKIDNFSKLNVGKSTLFAMTYDKICNINEFEIVLLLTKQPPCSTCVTKIAETHMDFTCEFIQLREELCKKWMEEQPTDNILCTTSSPLSKNMYYLSCCDGENRDSIGVIEVTVRMSFLGKEITTAYCASPKPQGTSYLLKEDHGMTMYSCHKVEMDEQGKILLDEGVMTRKPTVCLCPADRHRSESPQSQISNAISRRSYDCQSMPCCEHERAQKYDEIYTKMNVNELKIRVPKSSRVERIGKYDKIQELCSCESTAYNTGDQIKFELPRDTCYDNTYKSNLTYSVQPADKKDRRTINVTPTNCPIPVDMAKVLHPQKDVFILKIGKKLETKDKKTDLEIELVTPKAPFCDKSLESNNIGQQWSAGLGEFRIRDLNDEINKLMREKRHWEVQIKSLGGPDHARVGPKMLDQDGKEVPGNRGYKYFGAAKDLPGVRELFEQEPPPPPRRTRADLMRDVDADYYGYRDDDDGLLMPLEQEAEKEAIAQAVDEWKRNKEQDKDQDLPEEEDIYPEDPDDKRIEEDEDGEPVRPVVTSHVAVPSQKDIEEALLRRKKQELLEKYGCMDVKMEPS